jgi:hypothetical protein
MTNNFRVFNLTMKVWIKHRQAQKAVENCAATWVDPRTIRQLTLAEAISARNEQARVREPLGYAEIPGLKVAGIADIHAEMALAAEANRFFAEALQ